MLSRLRCLVVVFVCLESTAVAQQPDSVIRVGNYTVVVDVIVTDRDRRYLTDLTREDFLVYENGVLQDVETLTAIAADSNSFPSQVQIIEAKPGEAPVGPEEPVASSVPSRPNLIIVLLDYATVDYLNQNFVRDAAVRYVQESLRPNDLMAVFQVGMGLRFLHGFTNDREALARTLSQMDPAGSSYSFDQGRLISSAEGAQQQVEGLASQINVISNAGGFGPNVAVLIEYLNAQLEQAHALEGLYYAQLSYSREQQSRPVIGAIQTIADGVRHIPGRKTLILFSEGFSVPLTLEKALYQAVERASRANVAIYAIDGAGLRVREGSPKPELHEISADRSGDRVKAYGGLSLFDRAREVGSDQEDSTLRFLASSTGGFVVRNTNDFFEALQRIDEEMRSHYLLSYRPRDLTFDGEFRSIRVEVKKRGARVRFRSGYWAVPPGAGLLSADEYKSLLSPSFPSGKNRALTVYAHPSYFKNGEGRYDVNLTFEIPVSELSPQFEGDNGFAHLRLIGLVEDQAGNVVSSFRGPSRVRLGASSPDESQLLRLENQVDLEPGGYSLRFHVMDPVGKREAFRQLSLLLPSADGNLALSSLVVGEAVGQVSARETGLKMGEMRMFPSARRTFKNGERVFYYLNVYGPDLETRQAADFELSISLVRGGRTVRSLTEPLGSSLVRTMPLPHLAWARYIEFEGLEPGMYLLRASVHDTVGGETDSTQTSLHIAK